jgi:hypothetical protein
MNALLAYRRRSPTMSGDRPVKRAKTKRPNPQPRQPTGGQQPVNPQADGGLADPLRKQDAHTLVPNPPERKPQRPRRSRVQTLRIVHRIQDRPAATRARTELSSPAAIVPGSGGRPPGSSRRSATASARRCGAGNSPSTSPNASVSKSRKAANDSCASDSWFASASRPTPDTRATRPRPPHATTAQSSRSQAPLRVPAHPPSRLAPVARARQGCGGRVRPLNMGRTGSGGS